jgi:hypothetical protein
MSLFVQDTFAEARKQGLLEPGFVGTYADIVDILNGWAESAAEVAAELRAEQYYESGRAGADQYRWEEEQDRLRNPFDMQTGYAVAA